jgi:hypothetical protein
VIKGWQPGFTFIIMHMGNIFFLYVKLVYLTTNSGHWEVVMTQSLIQFLLMWLYIKALSRFPQNDIIDIYLKAGKWIAFAILLPIVVHLTMYVMLNIRAHSELLEYAFLPRTPFWAIMILLFFVSTYTSLKGLKTILRCSVFIFFLVIPCLIFIICSSMTNIDIHNASPFWNRSFDFITDKNFPSIVGSSMFLFLGLISSEVSYKFSRIVWAWALMVLLFLSVIYMPLLIFGQETIVTLFLPFIEATDSIEITWFPLNRATMFFGISLVAFAVLFNALLLWMIGQMAQKVTGCQKAKIPLVIIAFSVIAFISALFIPNWVWIEKLLLWNSIVQLCAIVFVPISIFLISFLHKKDVLENENF